MMPNEYNNEQTIVDHLNLVHAVIHREFKINKSNPFYEHEDLFQIGCLGLIKAVRTFNGSSKFSSYAYTIIKHSIIDELIKENKKYIQVDYEADIEQLEQRSTMEDEIERKMMIESFEHQLPEKKKPILNAIIAVQEGNSTKLVAEKMQCHERTLKNKMSLLKKEGIAFASELIA